MPHVNSGGGDDLASTDEVKVYHDEGEVEEEKRSSENLSEDKLGLVTETEEVSSHTTSQSRRRLMSRLSSFSSTRFGTTLLLPHLKMFTCVYRRRIPTCRRGAIHPGRKLWGLVPKTVSSLSTLHNFSNQSPSPSLSPGDPNFRLIKLFAKRFSHKSVCRMSIGKTVGI